MKYWQGKENETKLVVVSGKEIACGSPPFDKHQFFLHRLSKGEIPEELFSIPISYIKRIEMKDIEQEIKIYFGQESSEIIKIKDANKKQEIFEALKEMSPKFMYESKVVGKFGAAKKPLIALLVLTPIFAISFYMALLLENGELYGPQIALLLAIASLGTKNILKVFALILIIISVAIYRKMSKTHTLHVIQRK